ncbi:hypothetical protein ACFQ2B_34750 [Streptomyces stramineus]
MGHQPDLRHLVRRPRAPCRGDAAHAPGAPPRRALAPFGTTGRRGWGEHHRGCTENRYAEADESQPVSTAWALLALMDLTAPDDPAVLRGVRWLCSHQKPDGTWTPAKVNGVFFGTGMLDYRLYVRYFPLWALGRHLRRVPQQQAHER